MLRCLRSSSSACRTALLPRPPTCGSCWAGGCTATCAVHEALDQVGALAGPLVVAGVMAVSGGRFGPALMTLAVPGVLAVALVVWLRAQVPEPVRYEVRRPSRGGAGERASRLPRAFWEYAAFAGLTTTGFATFGVLSFHLVTADLLSATAVPLLYAAVMVVDAVAAVATGWAYDRFGAVVLAGLPVVAAVVPALGFSMTAGTAIAGALLWGAALGIQESTLRATVADLVGPGRRATAYGLFGAVVGVAVAAGGALAGGLYQVSVPLLVATTATLQVVALVVLVVALRARQDGAA